MFDSVMLDGTAIVSPPTKDSCSAYPTVSGITYKNFALSSTGLSPEQRTAALSQLQKYELVQKAHFLGYQVNQSFNYEQDLKQYLNYHINNVGDPFQSGNFTVNSKFMERAVLDYYASLWNARWPHDPNDLESYWGYVLTMGCTEGNLYGLWNGRDYLAGKFLLNDPTVEEEARKASLSGQPRSVPRRLMYQQARILEENPNAHTPVAFYSEDTHYSIIKAMRVMAMQNFYEIGTEKYPQENPLAPGHPWPKEVPSQGGNDGPGSIDIEALCKLVEFFAAKGYPILVCFNYGTTFKGAYDDVEAAGKALLPILKKYGLDERKVYYDSGDPTKYDIRNGYWFHVDGALGAAYMPFIEMAYNMGKISQRGPNFDFRLPFVHSIAMSGHKWIGAPLPCGIYMTKTKYQLRPPDDPEYIGSQDTTFAGSRNGFSAMLLWDYLAKNSYEAQVNKVLYTENIANYAYLQLKALEEKLGEDLWVQHTPLSLTIRFKRANDDIVFKYSLSSETLYVKGQKRQYSHIFLMAHVTTTLIDELIQDLTQSGAFAKQEEEKPELESDIYVTHKPKKLIHVPHTGRGFK
ncbi:pyridoxal-dependent decarboxylase [Nostoc sp. FACHB-152]|uniref:pyridoxal-dependent decarboxylase n=1 Tax=Nostoc sp. FACHB-152 TaxID=2692837 RepID=UPI0018EF8D87|nr:pyridoxal-dependent decarboxylase [Nostoc sp. FACHB-152]